MHFRSISTELLIQNHIIKNFITVIIGLHAPLLNLH